MSPRVAALTSLVLFGAACEVTYEFSPKPFDAGVDASGGGGASPATTTTTATTSSSSTGGGGTGGVGGVECEPAPELGWAVMMGGDLSDEPLSVAVDPLDGSIYTTGLSTSAEVYFSDSITGDGATDGFNDMYIAKTDKDGNTLWGKVLGAHSDVCSLSYRQRGQALALDPQGNVDVTGRFDCTLDFSPGGNCDTSAGCLIATGASPVNLQPLPDIFLAELDPNGNFLWGRAFGTKDYVEDVWDLTTDALGNIALMGKYKGLLDFGGSALPDAPTSFKGFLALFDGVGAHLWSAAWDGFCVGTNELSCRVVTDPLGNLYVLGSLDEALAPSIDFGAGPIACGCSKSSLVTRFNPQGGLDWARCLGSCSGDPVVDHVDGSDIVVSDDGQRIVVVGRIRGQVDLGFGAITTDEFDAFAMELGEDGVSSAVKLFPGDKDQTMLAAAFDAEGGLALAGAARAELLVEPCPLLQSDPAAPWTDAFVIHLDKDLNFDFGGIYGNGLEQSSRGIQMAPDGSIIFVGRAQGDVDYGGGLVYGHGRGAATDDILIAKLYAPRLR